VESARAGSMIHHQKHDAGCLRSLDWRWYLVRYYHTRSRSWYQRYLSWGYAPWSQWCLVAWCLAWRLAYGLAWWCLCPSLSSGKDSKDETLTSSCRQKRAHCLKVPLAVKCSLVDHLVRRTWQDVPGRGFCCVSEACW
jgi:hypothetical protein